MSAITTHVLDTARGRPAAGIAVTLEFAAGDGWHPLGHAVTDPDGRARDLLPAGTLLAPGTYRLRFATGDYHARHDTPAFYPQVTVEFSESDFHWAVVLKPMLRSGFTSPIC